MVARKWTCSAIPIAPPILNDLLFMCLSIDPADPNIVGQPTQGRKLVFLGDTCDSKQMFEAAQDCDVLVHEVSCLHCSAGVLLLRGCMAGPSQCTNAKLEEEDKASYEEIEEKAISHGHSTPQLAAKCSNGMQAGLLLLTHFSAR